jgi:hypothetical protein
MTDTETEQVRAYITQLQATHEVQKLEAISTSRYLQQIEHDKTTKHLNISRKEALGMGKALVQIEKLLKDPAYATLAMQFGQITGYYCQDYDIPF